MVVAPDLPVWREYLADFLPDSIAAGFNFDIKHGIWFESIFSIVQRRVAECLRYAEQEMVILASAGSGYPPLVEERAAGIFVDETDFSIQIVLYGAAAYGLACAFKEDPTARNFGSRVCQYLVSPMSALPEMAKSIIASQLNNLENRLG